MKRQTDPYGKGYEEVNKRIKQKNIVTQIAQYFNWFENKPSSEAKRKMKIKLDFRYK